MGFKRTQKTAMQDAGVFIFFFIFYRYDKNSIYHPRYDGFEISVKSQKGYC